MRFKAFNLAVLEMDSNFQIWLQSGGGEMYQWFATLDFIGGAEGIRTPDLLNAIQTRSQLRHSPT